MREFSDRLLSIYTGKLAGINLTRILNPEEFYQKQFLDSLIPAIDIELFNNSIYSLKTVVDIGFGGGFPIIPLAKNYQSISFLGIEARSKKVNAVRTIVQDLNLGNIKLHHERVENIFFDIPVVITFKAVGRIEKFLRSLTLVPGCKIFFYKGLNVFDEERELEFKGFNCFCKQKVSIPGVDNITRYLIGYESIVPRGTTKNKKNISKLL